MEVELLGQDCQSLKDSGGKAATWKGIKSKGRRVRLARKHQVGLLGQAIGARGADGAWQKMEMQQH